jgi:mannosyl-oligosaccharide alpha-1,2-mannosidase
MVLSRWRTFMLTLFIVLMLFFSSKWPFRRTNEQAAILPTGYKKGNSPWDNLPQQFPVTSMKPVPSNTQSSIPKIQFQFKKEAAAERQSRLAKLTEVKGNFTHAWNGYKDHAWLKDEVMPLSGNSQDPFGGWAATLVDSLGALPWL